MADQSNRNILEACTMRANSGYEMIKTIATREVGKLHLLEIGRVESVDIHESDDDGIDYSCSVLLMGRKTPEDEPLKLEHVQILSDHTGSVIVPYIDDLVVVGFINGDFAQPIILGRLHSKDKMPPIFEPGEHRLVFDPEQNRTGDGDTLTDRRIISFLGTEKKGSLESQYIIEFKDGSMINYDPKNIGLKTNYIEDGDKGDMVSYVTLSAKDKLKHSLQIGISKKKKNLLDLVESLLFGDNDVASLSIDMDSDKSDIVISRGKSKVEVKTESGSESTITIETGDTSIVMKQDGDIEISGKSKVTVKSEKEMSFEAKGDLSMKAPNITFKSDQKMNIEAGTDGIFKTGAKASISSTAPMEIKSGATAKIEATATMDIKGAMINLN